MVRLLGGGGLTLGICFALRLLSICMLCVGVCVCVFMWSAKFQSYPKCGEGRRPFCVRKQCYRAAERVHSEEQPAAVEVQWKASLPAIDE